jgi:hypothetical protein
MIVFNFALECAITRFKKSRRIGIEWNKSIPVYAEDVNILDKNINTIKKIQ